MEAAEIAGKLAVTLFFLGTFVGATVDFRKGNPWTMCAAVLFWSGIASGIAWIWLQ